MKITTVEDEYVKNPECNKDDIRSLSKWIETRPELPVLTERELIIFHQSNYFKMEDTKKCIDKYFQIRSQAPKIFSDRDPSTTHIQKLYHVTGYYYLNGLTPDGNRILIFKLINKSPSAYNFYDALKMYSMVSDVMFNIQGSTAGDIIIFDMTGVSFGHLPKLSVTGFKNILEYVQEGLPVRLKGIYLVNAISFIDILMNMMSPFMKKELLDMFHIKKNTEILNDIIPKHMLPKDYGGDGPSLEELHELTIQLINDQQDFFIQDENKRIKLQKQKGEVEEKISTGFRNLDLD